MSPSPEFVVKASDAGPRPPSLPREKPHPWRRFAARIIDLQAIWAPLMMIAFLSGIRLQPSSLLLILTPAGCIWVVIESFLLYHGKTTPGKWLLRVRVESIDSNPVTLARAFDRSLSVFMWGMGCCVTVISVICLAMSYQGLLDSGTTRWDRGKFVVRHESISAGRYALAIVALFGLTLVDVILRAMLLLR